MKSVGEEKRETETQKGQSRQDWIDLVRFLAIVVVMMNHAGLILPGVNYWGGMFYVPVFFVLSGFVWKDGREGFCANFARKFRRLMVPFFTTNIILVGAFLIKDTFIAHQPFTLLRAFGFLYGRNQLYADRYTLFGYPTQQNVYFMTALNSPTWFLPALFLTSLTMMVCQKVFKQRKKEDSMLFGSFLMLFAICWNYLWSILLPWSLELLPMYFALFYSGYLLGHGNGWEDFLKRRSVIPVMAVIMIVGGIVNGSANFSVGDMGQSMMLAFLNAVNASILIMFICWLLRRHVPKALAFVGRKTLPILCWHYPLLSVLAALRNRILHVSGRPEDICKAVEIIIVTVFISVGDEMFKKMLAGKKERKEAKAAEA
ncbi:MAG: acyltransferase [Lachnospiraceae bacterium]|nr:acyltransferase [Lachnospiraceae bacterium]